MKKISRVGLPAKNSGGLQVSVLILILVCFSLAYSSATAYGGSAQFGCVAPGCAGGQRTSAPQPRCAIELTCTDDYVQLGYSDGVCFRATCPGIWGLIHRRVDQASYRRRVFTYRHYHFRGYWDLKDEGAVQSGIAPLRELFLVLPDDLIELRLADQDCKARIEIKNLGYIKKGSVEELKKWLAYHSYLDGPALQRAAESKADTNRGCNQPLPWGHNLWSGVVGMGRFLGLPTCW